MKKSAAFSSGAKITFKLMVAAPKSYGERCSADQECIPNDQNLYCIKSETRVCRCRRSVAVSMSHRTVQGEFFRGRPPLAVITLAYDVMLSVLSCRHFVWDSNTKRCLPVEDDMYNGKFDPVRDLIIPAIIIMTIGAMVYLGIKLFCNW